LLEQHPGAFEDALRHTKPDGSGVREFVAILELHRDHPADMVNRAVKQALGLGAAHLDGVQLSLAKVRVCFF
jgi:hypothetical protein